MVEIPMDSLKPSFTDEPIIPITNKDFTYLDGQIQALKQKVDEFTEKVNDTIAALEQYKADNATAITTGTLTALNGIIDNLTTTEAIITAADIHTLSVESITGVSAQLDSIAADLINVDKIITEEVDTEKLISEEAVINALTVTDLIVSGSQTFQNLFVSNLEAGNATIADANVQHLSGNTIDVNSVSSVASLTTNSTTTNANIQNASINKGTLENLNIGAITHTLNHITIENDINSLIIAPPYFKNGSYRMIGISENEPLFDIVVYNNIRNIWFTWSRKPMGDRAAFIEVCRLYNIYEYPRAYFKLNTNGKRIDVYYTSDTFDLENLRGAPETFEDFPFNITVEGCQSYPVTRDDGGWFSKAVDIIGNSDVHDYAELTLTSTDNWELSGEPKTYNGTSAASYTSYKPNQSLNTDDEAAFMSVEAPFLGIANADIATKLTSPNIYNGPALSDTSTLEDETLYIPIDTVDGTTVAGIELLDNGSVDTFYSSSAYKAALGQTFLTDEYKPKEGYTLSDEVLFTEYDKDLNAIKEGGTTEYHNYLVRSDANGAYFYISPAQNVNKAMFVIRASDVDITGGVLDVSAGNTYTGVRVGAYRDAAMMDEIFDAFGPFPGSTAVENVLVEGARYFLSAGTNPVFEAGFYTVIRNNLTFRTTAGISFTRNNGGGKLYRKTTVDNVPQVLPLVPYKAVTDTPTPGYDRPLVYDSDEDVVKKGLTNIEVTGDVKSTSITTEEITSDEITTPSLTATEAVVDDLTVNNPVENLTVENLTVTDTAAINHATIVTEEDIHSEADFIELRVNNPLPTPRTGSGFKVKNYDGNNNDLEMVTDSNGTFRIGAGVITHTETKTDQFAVLRDGDYYISDTSIISIATTPTDLTFVSGTVVQPAAVLELYSYNGSYYYKIGTSTWYEVGNSIIVGGVDFSVWTYSGTTITDTDLIDALDADAVAETITDVVYKEATFEGSTTEDTNQPILTRDEEADLANGAPLVWNASLKKAQTSSTTDGNKVLKSVKNSTTGDVTYEWSSSGSGAVWRGTQAELTAALAITDPNEEAYIPNNAMIIITDSSDTFLIGTNIRS